MQQESEIIYFYKVDAPYGCFSNFSPDGINIDHVYWPTVEHYYQAHKFIGTENVGLIDMIRNVKTPMLAAQIGRNPQNIIRADWELVKRDIMTLGVLTKFTTHLELQKILLSTGNKIIVEDSPTDYYWGCGVNRTGQNHLGKILMDVRATILKTL